MNKKIVSAISATGFAGVTGLSLWASIKLAKKTLDPNQTNPTRVISGVMSVTCLVVSGIAVKRTIRDAKNLLPGAEDGKPDQKQLTEKNYDSAAKGANSTGSPGRGGSTANNQKSGF